jgi:hypothetical protein
MKKSFCILPGIFLISAFLWAAEIIVTSPSAGNEWCLGSTHTITWTKSGTMPATAAVRLRRAGAPETELAVVSITDSTANDGSLGWTIPASVPAGDYFIRVRTNSPDVIGDSPIFKIKSCPQAIIAGPRVVALGFPRTLTMPVTFRTSMKHRERYSWNCLRRMGTGAIEVPPSEMLVGFFNRRREGGALCADECVSQVYRGSPLWDAVRLRTLIGKTIVQATLSFRHKKNESTNPACAFGLAKVEFYSGRLGDMNPPVSEVQPIGPVALTAYVRIDLTAMMRNWLLEHAPGYGGDTHNYLMEFVGVNESMEFNSQECLSWFESGSLEIKYRD